MFKRAIRGVNQHVAAATNATVIHAYFASVTPFSSDTVLEGPLNVLTDYTHAEYRRHQLEPMVSVLPTESEATGPCSGRLDRSTHGICSIPADFEHFRSRTAANRALAGNSTKFANSDLSLTIGHKSRCGRANMRNIND